MLAAHQGEPGYCQPRVRFRSDRVVIAPGCDGRNTSIGVDDFNDALGRWQAVLGNIVDALACGNQSDCEALRLFSRLRCQQGHCAVGFNLRSEEHTSELQSLMRISYAVFCLKKKKSTHRS